MTMTSLMLSIFLKSYICWKPSKVSHPESAMIDIKDKVMGYVHHGANMHTLCYE